MRELGIGEHCPECGSEIQSMVWPLGFERAITGMPGEGFEPSRAEAQRILSAVAQGLLQGNSKKLRDFSGCRQPEERPISPPFL
jgi:hypothetical protein